MKIDHFRQEVNGKRFPLFDPFLQRQIPRQQQRCTGILVFTYGFTTLVFEVESSDLDSDTTMKYYL